MMFLLVIHYDRECAPQPFLLERIRDRGLVPNVQRFPRVPPLPILREEPENGETSLLLHLPLQLLHPGLDYQVNRFVGCDCHIEEFHKILKSGCRVEACRLQTAHRLIRYVTLCSVIAWRLYGLTYISRVAPTAPATLLLTSEEVAALQALDTGTDSQAAALLTTRDAVRRIAKLSGFLGRRSDGEPGITVLWRGWQRLSDLTLMWSLMMERQLMGKSQSFAGGLPFQLAKGAPCAVCPSLSSAKFYCSFVARYQIRPSLSVSCVTSFCSPVM